MGLGKFEIATQPTAIYSIPKGVGIVSSLEDRIQPLVKDESNTSPALHFRSYANSNGRCYEEPQISILNELVANKFDKGRTKDRARCCARGRPRRKSSRKSGGNQGEDGRDKKSRDDKGDQKDSCRSNRGGNGSRGNGGNDDDRGKKEDDNDEDNDDDDDDENNEEDEEEVDDDENNRKDTDSCDLYNVNEKNRDSEESVLEDMLRLVPSAELNCEPPEIPAKPGSLVNLHGVVVHETAGGLVILNVRWRNKVYSGAFIDIKKNRWPADRLDEEIPTNGTSVGLNGKEDCLTRRLNGKKGKKTSDDYEMTALSRKKGNLSGIGSEPLKSSPSKNGKRLSEQGSGDSSENERNKKRTRIVDKTVPVSPSSPPFIECPEPNCDKRYRHVNGLKYHQAHAHQFKSESKDEEGKAPVRRAGDQEKEKTSEQDFTSDQNNSDLIKVECIKKEEEDYTIESAPRRETTIVEIKTEKEDYSDSCDTTSINGDSVIVDVENTGTESDRTRRTPAISVETVSEDKDDKASDKSCESGDSCSRLKPDRINLATGESMFGLFPLMPPYFPSYLQHSPTLGSLNPQTLNNSLSSALQTSREIEGRNGDGNSQSSSSQGKMNPVTLENLKEYEKGLAQYAFNSQLLSRSGKLFPRHGTVGEDVIVASDEENIAYSPEALPGLYESIFSRSISSASDTSSKDSEKSGVKDAISAKPSGTEGPAKRDRLSPRRMDLVMQYKQGQSQSIVSSSLFQQLSQERLNNQLQDLGNTNTNSDLAAPADIQQALSKVDIRRHFSPMLLNYLKPCRGDGNTACEETESADVKRDPSAIRPEGNDAIMADSAAISLDGKSGGSITSGRVPQPFLPEDPKGSAVAMAATQLQPNISIGRPISRPVQKPDSITGGSSSSGKFRDDNSLKISSGQSNTAKERPFSKLPKEAQEKSPGSEATVDRTMSSPHSFNKDNTKNDSSLEGSEPPQSTESSAWQKGVSSLSNVQSKFADLKPSLSSSASERNLVEAKTWMPQGMTSATASRTPETEFAASDLKKTPSSVVNDAKERSKTNVKGVSAISSPPQGIFSPSSLPTESQKIPSPFSVMPSKNLPNPRSTVPVPIAPAPVSKSVDSQRIQDKIESDNGARDVPHISRFTLTSDNRLVPSPAENRGRPRKVRVEKTQQIPIGTAHDVEVIARIEDRPKKQQQQQQQTSSSSSSSAGNMVRASVIHSMAPSTTPQKATFSSKESMLPKDVPPMKSKAVGSERGSGTHSEKTPITIDYKKRPSFETHGFSSQDKRPRVDAVAEEKRSPDSERERSFKPLSGETGLSSHRIEDRLSDIILPDEKRYSSTSSRPSSVHSVGRGPPLKDDLRSKFPNASSTPLPVSMSSEMMKSRTSLAESSYLGLPPQFVGQFSATQRMHPGIPYPGLYLNPAFSREMMNDQMAGCLPPGLRDEPCKGTSSKDRFEREKTRSPAESAVRSARDLPSPRDHLIPHHLAKQHSSVPGFSKSTPDPLRISRDALRSTSRTREQSPIFLGAHNAPTDPSRGLRPSPESSLSRSMPDRPLYGGGPQYLTPLSPSLLGRLRPEGPPDITSRQGQGRLHEGLLDAGRLRRDYPDNSSHPPGGVVTSRPTYLPQHSQSAGPALYPETIMNRSTPFGLRSTNLILSRADGAIVGPLPFDGRQPDSNPR